MYQFEKKDSLIKSIFINTILRIELKEMGSFN